MVTKAHQRSVWSRLNWVDGFLWFVRVLAAFVILWGVLGALVLSFGGEGLSGAAWKDLIVGGVAQGSMYGLIALGYSMVYGVLEFINFAHGEVFMSGAMAGFFVSNALFDSGMWDSNFILAIGIVTVVAILTSTLVAIIVERVAYRPLRNAPRLIPLITSIGVSFFLQYAAFGLFGPAVKNFPAVPKWLQKPIPILGLDIEGTKLVVIVIALISMIALYLFVERSRTGRSMRAVAEDKEIAALMGIDVDRTIVITFAVGGAMAGVASVIWAMLFRSASFIMGFLPGVKAFTAAVLGGIGNMVGAMLGGVTLGVLEVLGPNVVLAGMRWRIPLLAGAILLLVAALIAALSYARRRFRYVPVAAVLALGGLGGLLGWTIVIPGVSQLKDVVAFSALVLVLIFKPSGLLGEQLAEEDRA